MAERRETKATARDEAAPLAQDRPASNASLVVSAIRRAEAMARIDISRRTGLSPATVTTVTSDLIEAGLLEELRPPAGQPPEHRRGRPRVLLGIRGDARCVVGAKLSDRKLTCTVLDFRGALIADAEYPVALGPHPPEEVAEMMAAATEDVVARAGLGMGQISAVGLGVPGFVDNASGRVYWSPAIDRRNVDLLGLLRPRLSCPVFLDNDANLVAMAEIWFGVGRQTGDFIVVTLEHGVGMGIVIGNRLYRGARGCGAEFGHTKVQLDGALCRCGQRGCLEAYVGDYALLREADLVLGPAAAREIAPEERLGALYVKALEGDAGAEAIFRRAGRLFGMGLANVVNIFDPALIVLSGESMRYHYLYGDDAMAVMRANILELDNRPPEVRVNKWGDLLWAKGAAALALEGVTELALDGFAREPG